MYRGTPLACLFFSLFVVTSRAVKTVANLDLTTESNTTVLQLFPDVLQGDAYRDVPCHAVSICGKQGVMKSTLLRALGLYLDMSDAGFQSDNKDYATTTSIDISDVSSNHLLIDSIGNDDPSFALKHGLGTLAVDKAFSQLAAPVSNVLIYVSAFIHYPMHAACTLRSHLIIVIVIVIVITSGFSPPWKYASWSARPFAYPFFHHTTAHKKENLGKRSGQSRHVCRSHQVPCGRNAQAGREG